VRDRTISHLQQWTDWVVLLAAFAAVKVGEQIVLFAEIRQAIV
jgi:hypothetical protein